MKITSYLRLAGISLVSLAAAGCVTIWSEVDSGSAMAKKPSFSVELPAGWMRYQQREDKVVVDRKFVKVESIVITRDGLNLQKIDIINFGKENAFPHIKKSFKETMLPTEVAELMIAELKASPGMEALTINKNEPVTLQDKDGVMLLVSFKNQKGLVYKNEVVALGDKSGLYVLSYRAPELYYFGTYQPVFEQLMHSFSIGTNKVLEGSNQQSMK